MQLTFKDLVVDTDTKYGYINGKQIKLTKNEINLLTFLISNKNKIFTKRDILKGIGKVNVSLRALDIILSRLRHKLGDYSSYITNRFGFGYGMVE